MIPPIKKFAPYTASKLRSLRSLKKLARRIKTRALRAIVATAATASCLAIFAMCEGGDDVQRRTVVQRHDTVATTAVPTDTGQDQ